ncbi:hypothetical protein ABZ897_41625 [Nonomuraea sp. NPDC046802]|uniref:hypothetical protein n=1 Tax=Nonomuraea sp. NPDC046802 TaxID=3154919 RepID=UPI00340733C9
MVLSPKFFELGELRAPACLGVGGVPPGLDLGVELCLEIEVALGESVARDVSLNGKGDDGSLGGVGQDAIHGGADAVTFIGGWAHRQYRAILWTGHDPGAVPVRTREASSQCWRGDRANRIGHLREYRAAVRRHTRAGTVEILAMLISQDWVMTSHTLAARGPVPVTLDRASYVLGLGTGAVDCAAVAPVKLAELARFGMTAKAFRIEHLEEDRRLATLLAIGGHRGR